MTFPGIAARDVRNRFFISVQFKKNSNSVRNEFGSVQKMRFGSVIVVSYYLCNS